MKKQQFSSLVVFPDIQKALSNAAGFVGKDSSLPPMLLIMPTSADIESIMDDLCTELEAKGLVNFTGTKKWLSVFLNRSANGDFYSFQYMIKLFYESSGYRNSYSGVAIIDLSDWIDDSSDQRMVSLLAYIYDHRDDIFFILTVKTDQADHAKDLKRIINRWLYSQTVYVTPLNPKQYISYIEKKLAKHKFTVTDDAKLLIAELVKDVSKREDFGGMREIESIYTAIAVNTGSLKIITEQTLSDMKLESIYMNDRFSQKLIGF